MGEYLLTLVLTLVIEAGVAAAFGYRDRLALRTVVLVNLMTHPLLNAVLWWGDLTGLFPMTLLTILFLEGVVVLVEWGLLAFVFQTRFVRLFALSFSMNAASFLTGVVLLWP
ncbi:MAG: hypothetical protein AB1646_13900 [Thermodesulfobacteriota bacterium]